MLTTTKLIVPALTLLGIGAVLAHGQVFRISTTTDSFLPFFETGDDINPGLRGARFIRGDDASFGFGGADLDPAGTPRGPIQFLFTADLDAQTRDWSHLTLQIIQGGGSPSLLVQQDGSADEAEAFALSQAGRLFSGLNTVSLDSIRLVAIFDSGFSGAATGYLGFEQPIEPISGGRANLLPFDTGFNSNFATDPTANIISVDLLSSTTTSSGFYVNYTGLPSNIIPFLSSSDIAHIAFGGFTTDDLAAQSLNFSSNGPEKAGNEAFVFAVVIDPGPLTADPNGVFGPGASSTPLFDEVIDVSDAPGAQTSIGASFGDQQFNPGPFIRNSIGDATNGASTTVQLNVANGGAVASDFVVLSGGEVNITGGTVGNNFNAHSGTEVNISGGSVGNDFDAFNGSQINISGGTVGNTFEALPLSEVNISGGSVGNNLAVSAGSRVNVSGGIVGTGLSALERSEVNVSSGSIADDFTIAGVLNVSGGSVGRFTASAGSEVNISGGVAQRDSQAFASTVNISGGTLSERFNAFSGSIVNVTGGGVGALFTAELGSEVNISGGTLGVDFSARGGSVVTISGGMIGAGFSAFGGSQINLFGAEFFLNGVPITPVAFSTPVVITDRDATLTGTLADGTAFSFALDSVYVFGDGFFDPSATLTITRVCEADFNSNGFVDNQDLLDFVTALESGDPGTDIDGSPGADFFDVLEFLELVEEGCQ